MVNWTSTFNPASTSGISCKDPVLVPGQDAGRVEDRLSALGSAYLLTPRFLWECFTSRTIDLSPVPAALNPPCRYPAVGFPVRFLPRFM
jgi:hypothetical protein